MACYHEVGTESEDCIEDTVGFGSIHILGSSWRSYKDCMAWPFQVEVEEHSVDDNPEDLVEVVAVVVVVLVVAGIVVVVLVAAVASAVVVETFEAVEVEPGLVEGHEMATV
jgi:hypothetical protein